MKSLICFLLLLALTACLALAIRLQYEFNESLLSGLYAHPKVGSASPATDASDD